MAASATSSIQNPSPSDSVSVTIQAETESKTDKKDEASSLETKGRNPEETAQNPKDGIKTEGSYEANQSSNEGKEGTLTGSSHETDQNANEGKGGIVTEGSHEPDQNPNEEESIMTAGRHETDQNPNQGEQEEEEGECPFCLFMKGGGCRGQFIAWENCVEEAEAKKEDVVEKCYKVTSLLKECMDLHSDYYEPVLRAERAMDEEIAAEMKERESQETAHAKEAEMKERGSQETAHAKEPESLDKRE